MFWAAPQPLPLRPPQKLLYFPASAFAAGRQGLTLAAKNIYGEGQASVPLVYNHAVRGRAGSMRCGSC